MLSGLFDRHFICYISTLKCKAGQLHSVCKIVLIVRILCTVSFFVVQSSIIFLMSRIDSINITHVHDEDLS